MHWTEPATADNSHAVLEKTLWDAANQLWAGAYCWGKLLSDQSSS